MGEIKRRMGIMSLICFFASLVILTFSADAGAQHGGGMMLGPCGMCGKGPGTMPMMGGHGHGAKHPSSTSLTKMLHQWGRLFFVQKDQLGLTEEQLDEIESILTSHIKDAIRKKADLKVLLIEIQEVLVEENIDLKAVGKKLKAMEALNTEMAMEGVRTLKKALAVLTPEQQKKIRRLFKNSTLMRTKKMGMMPGSMMQGIMGPGMMPCMMGQGGAAPGLHGPVAHLVHQFGHRDHIFGTAAGGKEGLVAVAQAQVHNFNRIVRCWAVFVVTHGGHFNLVAHRWDLL